MMDRESLIAACRAHGIDDTFTGIDGITREVPTETLAAIAASLRIHDAEPIHRATIHEALEQPDQARSYVPDFLHDGRAWGFACQLGSLRSDRNAGIGDFADLAALVRVLAAMGADFVGLNPLHALFPADPGRASPFSPSNRMFLNHLYLAVDRIEGYDRLDPAHLDEAARLRETGLVDLHAVRDYKNAVLGTLFDAFPWTHGLRDAFAAFKRRGGKALRDHALFGAISKQMVAKGRGAGWTQWPDNYHTSDAIDAQAFASAEEHLVEYQMWCQWIADRQLGEAAAAAREAGMRVGLYLDLAVGAAPDGSATWSDPALTVPGLHVGAPPDPFSATGQDWGLAPLSPVALAESGAAPIGDMLGVVMRHAGAVRIDHAMGLARLWLIPAGRPALEGAYVRYPLVRTLDTLARVTNDNSCMVIGEDLGVVPEGFRPLMELRDLHAYKVFFFERDENGFRDPATWSPTALACVGTHDTASFPGWWAGHDIEVRRAIGQFDDVDVERERHLREEDRGRVRAMLGQESDPLDMSLKVHAHVARSPCRLAVVQIDDALGTLEQPNVPGTIDEHPNWRRKMAVKLDELQAHEGFARHAEAMRASRPR